MKQLTWFVIVLAVMELTLGASGPYATADDAFSAESIEFFEKKVRPLLSARCFECHRDGEKKIQGGLRLDSRQGILTGGDTGAAAIPGKPAESLIIDAINYGVYQMPPKSKLPAEEIAIMTQWVEMGLPWPPESARESAPQASNTTSTFDIEARKRSHWSWSPLSRAPVPAVKHPDWTRSPSDQFLLAALEAQSLPLPRNAEPLVLLRRMYLDLIGLPPSIEEQAEFQTSLDAGQDATQSLERVADQLLASPHFGERWARHWLDLVRFAETRGHEFEPLIPNAWQYRDYLIRALNADVAYDQFVREHLAGDLLTNPRTNPANGSNESVLGTGFWFLGEEVHSPVDIRQDEADRIDNRLDVMSKTFLGLTVGCARCHDHKFDAISQQDYYALTGFLLSASYRQVPFESLEHNQRVAQQLDALRTNAGRELPRLFANSVQGSIARLAEYLQVALEVARSLPGAEATISAPAQQSIAQLSRERNLDSGVVAKWVNAIKMSLADANSPLQPFARIASADVQVADVLAQWERLRASPSVESPVRQVLLDFMQPEHVVWYPDGPTFGLRPSRPGDLIFSASGKARLVTYQGARRDPAFHSLTATADCEKDHGVLGDWQRSGRSLRTRTITLQNGNLFYLVRGSGRAYAVVDSHLVVAGPLHGRLLMEWESPPDQWKWIRHDLTPYRDHRVHVEFVPRNEGEFAIGKAVESEQEPPLPTAYWERLARAWAGATDVAAMTRGLQAVMENSLATFRAGAADANLAVETAEFVSWMMEHDELFVTDEAARVGWQAALTHYYDAEKLLIQQVRRESHIALAMYEGNGVDEQLLIRGSTRTPGMIVPRRFLESLGGASDGGYGSGSGRLQLAEQILDRSNPYTARVFVNRVWHHLFGRGIVPTVDNFGVLGQPPSHPQLLDWIASHFRDEQNWSSKQLIRSLVISKSYQMTSQPDSAAVALDPGNTYFHHWPVRRLQAEAIRDSILAVSGRIDRRVLGPPVDVFLTPFMDGRGKPGASGPLDGAGRRSIYHKVRRNFLSPMMLAFDSPIPFSSIGRRSVSNVPAQALIMLNDPFVVQQASVWAMRELAIPADPEQRIKQMYITALTRLPSDWELREAVEFLQEQGRQYDASAEAWRADPRVWSDFAHVLLNTKEFIFVQ